MASAPAPPPSPASRIFLALGALVALFAAYRVLRSLFLSADALHAALSSPETAGGASPAWRFAAAHPAALLVFALASAVAVVGVSAGVIGRRPWARPAAIGLLALGAAAGFAGAAFQAFGLIGESSRGAREASEAGFGAVLGVWRVGGGLASLAIGIFSVAALRRFASSEMRREFSKRGGGTPL